MEGEVSFKQGASWKSLLLLLFLLLLLSAAMCRLKLDLLLLLCGQKDGTEVRAGVAVLQGILKRRRM